MKSMIILFLFLILICNTNFFSNQKMFIDCNANKVSFILSEKVDEENILQNGNDYIVDIYQKYNDFYLLNKDKIKGFNLYFYNKINIKVFCNKINADIFQGKDIENNQIFYGYTTKYNDFRFVGGKKINIQIAQNETCTIIGFPLILTGF